MSTKVTLHYMIIYPENCIIFITYLYIPHMRFHAIMDQLLYLILQLVV